VALPLIKLYNLCKLQHSICTKDKKHRTSSSVTGLSGCHEQKSHVNRKKARKHQKKQIQDKYTTRLNTHTGSLLIDHIYIGRINLTQLNASKILVLLRSNVKEQN